MTSVRPLGVALACAVLAALPLHAQHLPLSMEAQAGTVIPTGAFRDAATPGFGYGLRAGFRVVPAVDVYAGYSWHRFGAPDGLWRIHGYPMQVDLDDSGVEFGGRARIGGLSGIEPWVRGGLLVHQLKMGFRVGTTSTSNSSSRAMGYEAAGGAAIFVAPHLSFMPSLSFRSWTPKFDSETDDVALTYIGLHVAGRVSF